MDDADNKKKNNKAGGKPRAERSDTRPLKMSTANARHSSNIVVRLLHSLSLMIDVCGCVVDIDDIELGEIAAARPAAFNPEFNESSQTNDYVGEYAFGYLLFISRVMLFCCCCCCCCCCVIVTSLRVRRLAAILWRMSCRRPKSTRYRPLLHERVRIVF
jgi:hypothetical protein